MARKRRRNTGEAAKKRFRSEKPTVHSVTAKALTVNSNDVDNKPPPKLIQEAKYYLELWQQQQTQNPCTVEWRFKKAKQVWVLRWMYRADVVNKSLFCIVLDYLAGMQGTARERVLREAQEIIESRNNTSTETCVTEEAGQTLEQKLQRRKLKRAFQIAKALA